MRGRQPLLDRFVAIKVLRPNFNLSDWRLDPIILRAINRMKAILRRHNLEQECPTKGIQTQRARKWLDGLSGLAHPAAER